MSTQSTKRYHGSNWCIDLMDKPWWIDVLTAGIVVAWMAWTFATMQTHGPSLELIGSAVVVGVVGILWIYGQRITYFRFGDWIVVGMERDTHEGEREAPWDED